MDAHAADILLVEDNPHDAELTMRSLRKRNLANHLLWVKDGEEALDYLCGAVHDLSALRVAHAPKLVLLDLKLPKVDGLEVLRRMKANEQCRSIPVAVLTSSREERDVAMCYRLGVNSYVVKPLEFESFSDAVAQLGLYWLLLNQPPTLVIAT